jgi:hypothetical protein
VKTRRTAKFLEEELFHLFLYGLPGSGKTKFAGDFHKAGQDIILVTGEKGEMTLDVMGIDAPILSPESEDEIRAIVEQPQIVVEKIVHNIVDEKTGELAYPDYNPKTWVFDNFRTLQLIMFGNLASPAVKVFDGEIVLEKEKSSGVLSLPHRRGDSGTPAQLDYRQLDLKSRGLIRKIEDMPYHTIITAHAEHNFDIKTHLSLTGDPDLLAGHQLKAGRSKQTRAGLLPTSSCSWNGMETRHFSCVQSRHRASTRGHV